MIGTFNIVLLTSQQFCCYPEQFRSLCVHSCMKHEIIIRVLERRKTTLMFKQNYLRLEKLRSKFFYNKQWCRTWKLNSSENAIEDFNLQFNSTENASILTNIFRGMHSVFPNILIRTIYYRACLKRRLVVRRCRSAPPLTASWWMWVLRGKRPLCDARISTEISQNLFFI